MKYFCFVLFTLVSTINAQNDEVIIRTVNDFLDNLRPGVTLIIERSFSMEGIKECEPNGKYYKINDVYGDKMLVVSNLRDLKIVGKEGEDITILTPYEAASVINFNECRNITLENLRMGHDPQPGYPCEGYVTGLVDCDSVNIINCTLYGSGIYGIYGNGVTTLNVSKSVITKCSECFVFLWPAKKCRFSDCRFSGNNLSYDGFSLSDCRDILIENCEITDNICAPSTSEWDEKKLISGFDSFNIRLRDCKIEGNQFDYFTDMSDGEQIFYSGTKIPEDNFRISLWKE